MFGIFGNSTTEIEVFVGNADTMPGFYAAMALKECSSIKRVICGVVDREDEFSNRLSHAGLHIREWNPLHRRSVEDALKDVEYMLLIPEINMKCEVGERGGRGGRGEKGLLEGVKNILEAVQTSNLTHLILWSDIGVSSLRDLDNIHGGNNVGEEHHHHHKWMKMLMEIEEMVERVEVEKACIVRIGFPQQKLFLLSHLIQDRGILPLPTGRGKFAPVNYKDCSLATAKLLLGHTPSPSPSPSSSSLRSTRSKGRTACYNFTGPTLLTARQLVERANRVLNSEIEFEDVGVEEFRKILRETGELNKMEVEVLLEGLVLVREGKYSLKTEDLSKILERELVDVEKFFKDNADAFRPGGGRVRRHAIREVA